MGLRHIRGLILVLALAPLLSACSMEWWARLPRAFATLDPDADPSEPLPEAITVTVEKVYPLNSNWNSYVKYDNTGGGTNPNNQDDVACTAAETGPYNEIGGCIHSGERRSVTVTGQSSCTGLTITDALGVWNWQCVDTSGTAVFYTQGFKSGKGLADLVTASAWRANAVSIAKSGYTFATSSSTVWGWTNTITPLPANAAGTDPIIFLDGVDDDGAGPDQAYTAGTIFTLASSRATSGYNLNLDRLGIVTLNGAELQSNATVLSTNLVHWDTGDLDPAGGYVAVSAGSQKFLWIEVAVTDAPGDINSAVYLILSQFSRVHRLRNYGSAWEGMLIHFGGQHLITDAVVSNSRGFSSPQIYIWDSHKNKLSDVRANANQGQSVATANLWLRGDDNVISNINASDGNVVGIDVWGSRNILSRAIVSGTSEGIVIDSTDSNIVHGATIANVGTAALHRIFHIMYSTNITINNVVSANNNAFTGGNVVVGTGSDGIKLSQIASAHSTENIHIAGDADNVVASGNILLGPSASSGSKCLLTSSGTNLGFAYAGTDCANAGTSNANFVQGVSSDFTSSFVGKTGSSVLRSTLNALDINGLPHLFQGWGFAAGAFPNATNQGYCDSSSTCQKWDWRLLSTDTKLRNRTGNGSTANSAFTTGAACPTEVAGSKTITSLGTPGYTYLVNAFEIMLDDIGNDNSLCESGEACLYMPNFGAYQGEGDYLANGKCVFQNGTVSNVTMYAFPTNGF